MTLDLVQEPPPSLPESLAPRTEPAGRRRSTPRAHVVAVVVARDGATRLPRVLAALASSTRAPDVVAGVDLGSADGSAELLATVMPVLVLPRSATPHDGVEAVLALRAAGHLEHADQPDGGSSAPTAHPSDLVESVVEWVWLVPDDAAPAADALEKLLLAVETAPSVGVGGCKQVTWDDDQRLLDVGFTASPLGLRVTGVDRGEVDQGQHDGRSDVLAVSGAGMLVRRDVWDALGGLDPGLPAAAGDLDLCRRAHRAGHRVVVVPGAVVARGVRRPPRRAARRAVLHLRLAAVPPLLLPLAVVAVVVLAPVRALLLLVWGRGDAAADEVAATAGVLAHPFALARTRRRGRRSTGGRRVPPRVMRTLRPPVDLLLRQRYDAVHTWVAPPVPDTPPPPPPPRHLGAGLAMLLVTVLAGAALGRDLLFGHLLAPAARPAGDGPLLDPVPRSASALWAAATGTWRHVGLGAPAAADPWAGLLAVLSAPLGGDPALAQRVLLAAAVPLAAVTAWCAAAALTRSRVLRWWAALAWAAAPPLLGAVLAGRPAAAVAHVLLPLFGPALAGCRAADRRPAACTARLGLLLTALLAAAPSLALPALAVLAGATLLPLPPGAGAGPRRLARRALPLLAAAVPAGLLLPWWAAVARAPRLLLAVADGTSPAPAGLPGTTADGVPWWHLLALPSAPGASASGAGVPGARLAAAMPGWAAGGLQVLVVVAAAAVVAPLAVAAVAGPLRRRAGGAAVLGWWAAGAGLLLAAALQVTQQVGQQGTQGGVAAQAQRGPALSLALAGLGAAGLLGAQVLPTCARRTARPQLARAALVGAAVVALAGPALVLGVVAAAGTGAPRQAAGLPAVAAAEAAGPNATRTLVLAVDRSPSRVRWALARGPGLLLGDASAALAARPGPGVGERDAPVVLPAVAELLSAAGRDARPRLARLAVGSVVLLPPADAGTVIALDAAPGLTRQAGSGGTLLWRVDPPVGSALTRPARARIVDARTGAALGSLPSSGDEVEADVAPGRAGRLVVLAERHDDGWQARLDGTPLAPARSGWAQAFVLPARGGHLEVTHDDGTLALADPGRAGLLGLALLLALPMPRLRGRVGPPPPPRPSRPVPRPAPAPDDLQPAPPPQVFDDDHPEGGARPLYVGPQARRLRRMRLRRMRLRQLMTGRRPPGGDR